MDISLDSWIESRFVCGSVILCLSVLAILANLFIISYDRLPNNKPVICLAISSIIYQLCNLVVYVPCSYTSCTFYNPFWLKLLSVPNTVCYNVCHLCFTHLSIERMLIFYSDSLHGGFQKKNVYVSVFIWIYISTLAAVGTVFGCVKTFDVPMLRYYYNVDQGGGFFSKIYLGHSISFTITMVTCYIMIFIKIQIMFKRLGQKRKEVKLVFQYFFISAFAWFSILFFFFVPNIKQWLNLRLTLIPSLVSTISASSHCYVFFVFDKQLRQSVKQLFCRLGSTQQTSTNRLRSTGNSSSRV